MHIKNATTTPRVNVQIEKYNSTITNAIATMATAEGQDWDQNLRSIQWSLNNTSNKTTRRSPHEFLFSYTPRNEDDTSLSDLRRRAQERIRLDQLALKRRYDSKRKESENYQEIDMVLFKREPIATGMSKKLSPKYKGPVRSWAISENKTTF